MSGLTITFGILALAVVFGPRLIRAWNDFFQRQAFAQDIANVRLIQGPRLIASEWEGDTGVYERAETLRGLLALSGNEWITPEDIMVEAYSPHRNGKTGLTFYAWRVMVQQEFEAKCAKHYARVHGTGQFDAALHGQRIYSNGQTN